jgi:4-aminobutyrate aminotransferase-like enzyme
MPTARRAEIAFTHGKGAYLYATDGKRYLDFLAGIGVCSLGHAHPQLVAAMQGLPIQMLLDRYQFQEHTIQLRTHLHSKVLLVLEHECFVE